MDKILNKIDDVDPIEKWKEYTEIAPANALVWYFYGENLARAKRYEEGLEAFEMARNLDPEDLDIVVMIGKIYEEIGNLSKAKKYALNLINENKRYYKGWIFYCQILLKERKYDHAAQIMRQAIDIHPNDWDIKKYYAITLILNPDSNNDDYLLARRHLEQYVDENGEDIIVDLYLAYNFLKEQNYNAFYAKFSKLLELDENNHIFLYILASCLILLDNLNLCISFLHNARENDSFNDNKNKIIFNSKFKDIFQKIIDALIQALKNRKREIEIVQQRNIISILIGKFYIILADYKKAEEIYKDALSYSPRNYLLLIYYGRLLMKINQLEKALEIFQAARNYDNTEENLELEFLIEKVQNQMKR
jgi:tetratricopeptide (TPR) repeat protein